ncbi:alpha/beta fold hydrolase [Microlunatus sp. GCM10028923]|uniref:alpha/beta fold hydrolase n=1 Tax=Microlunatus sp. GCM10028923 TaxID=3273400 RepID=UPI00360AC552
MRLRPRLAVSALAAAALIISVLSGAPAAQAEEAQTPEIPQRYLDQEVTWKTCDWNGEIKESFDKAPEIKCAMIKVPMDWNNPNHHPDIELSISRSLPTSESSSGLLTANPGGPNIAGVKLPAEMAKGKPWLFERFELVGFDPRGVGESTPLSCQATNGRLAELTSVPDHKVRNDQTWQAETDLAQLVASACGDVEYAEFVSTQQTVYDLDFLRAYFKAEVLNYVGFSYGTWLGAWYADTFPYRVGRFMLDSNMDWTGDWDSVVAGDGWAFQRRRDGMFFPWLARHHETYKFGKTVEDVARSYDEIRSKIAERSAAGEAVMRPESFDDAVSGGLYGDKFPEVAEAMQYHQKVAVEGAAAIDEDQGAEPSAQDLVDAAKKAPDTELTTEVDLADASIAIQCNDSQWNDLPSYYTSRADQDGAEYPFVGYVNAAEACAFWEYEPTPRTIELSGPEPILMVQSEGDPATPYEGARNAHELNRTSTILISLNDNGAHALWSEGYSPCVEEIGDRFLRDGGYVSESVCEPKPLPHDDQVYAFEGPIG